MTAFTFRVDPCDRDPMERTRSFNDETEALAYATQLLKDWPECPVIDVVCDGVLLSRLRRPPA